MTLIDRDGRVFGRFNLVDALAAAFVLLLLPIGYATFLLFRPSHPVIDSVTRVEVTKEERRVAGGSLLTAKLKVTGSGFNPLLRAAIGSTPALGLVFETPNSADVLVGLVPPGKHDLVLYDGVQEVARAREAVEIQSTGGPSVHAYGWLTSLSQAQADALKPGLSSDAGTPGAFQIVALGPVGPARARVAIGAQAADLPVPGLVERGAEMVLRCDWPSAETCTVGGESLTQSPPIAITLPGGMRFEIDEIAPPGDARSVIVHLRLAMPVSGLKPGDRDAIVSASAAEIVAVAGNILTLKLGVHDSREGWRYRGQLITPGSTLILRTPTAAVSGTVIDATVTGQ